MPTKTPRATDMPAELARYASPVVVSRLSRSEPLTFDLVPDANDLETVTKLLGVRELNAVRFKGKLRPSGDEGWLAEARLTARVVQDCVVTLAPVRQRVDERVRRAYVPDDALEQVPEVELDMDADDDPDTFDREIDLGALMVEALALALDPYPRADDAELDQSAFAPPGAEPLTDEALKPFAQLGALRDKLAGGET